MILFNSNLIDPSLFSEKVLENGISIYEVIRVFNKEPIFLHDNLLRLDNSIKKSNLDIDISKLHIEDQLHRLISLEKMEEGNIKYVLHITNGQIDEYIYRIPHSYPTAAQYHEGVRTATYAIVRDNPEVKYHNAHLRTISDRLMKEKQVYEILLTDKEGCITEGSRSNVFFIKEDVVYTAPVQYVLPGTSRKRVIDICNENHFRLREERIVKDALKDYEAAFITGTSPLILPVCQIDEDHFNPNHPLLRKLMKIYFSMLK